ncbi:MAG: hypothetical protein ACRDNF_15975 [Streptosporangiaceae bacterium]
MKLYRRLAVAAVAVLVGGLAGPGAAAAGTDPSWVIQSTPNHSGARSSMLYAVSCSSATVCTAVGEYENRSRVHVTLAERWNGAKWRLQPSPNHSGARSSMLYAVSCPSATACTATGTYRSRSGVHVTLAERWNGAKWRLQPSPNPSGAQDSRLLGVSCSSAMACTATGTYVSSSGASTLTERWNGAKWRLQSTPNRSGALVSALDSVSCASALTCVAAGAYGSSSGAAGPLAERWNGATWLLQSTPSPSGARYSQLDGVSCSSATACTAVGAYQDKSGVYVTMAERYS